MAKTSPNDVIARYGNWYRGSDDLFAHCFVRRSGQSVLLFQGLQTVTLQLFDPAEAEHRQLAELLEVPIPGGFPEASYQGYNFVTDPEGPDASEIAVYGVQPGDPRPPGQYYAAPADRTSTQDAARPDAGGARPAHRAPPAGTAQSSGPASQVAPHSTRGVDGAPGVPDDDLVPIFPETFGGQAVVGFAGPFIVTVAPDNPETRAGAEAILASAAQDLATLENWFSYRWSDQPYGPWVSVGDDGDPSPHGANTWFYGDQSPRIEVYGATLANAGGSPAIRDELARMLFVAELAEVFMDAAPTNWNPNNSGGEALSRVAGAELHPAGYYRPAGSANNGPYSTAWLQLPWRRRDAQPDGVNEDRYDFVTVSIGTDTDVVSFGCGILFLYYLHDQLRYSWKQIASSNGDHLAQTFAELTGRPEQSAFPEFADVLDAHLAPGTSVVPPRESVFPLRAHPAVLLYETYGASHSARRDDGLYIAMLKPGPLCPEEAYEYHVVDMTTPVTVTARAPGSFAPSFQWFVGGTRVTAGPSQQVTVRVRVVDTRPGTGEPAEDDVPLRLRCTVTDSATTSQLDVVNLDFPGNIEGFEVKAVLSEAGVSVIPGLLNATTTVAPRTRGYAMSWQWYRDVERCNPDALWQVGVYRNALLAKVFDLKNRPDPPSPEVLADLVAAAARYGAAAQELTRTASGVAGTLEELVPALAAGLVVADAAEEVRVDGRVFRALPAVAAPATD